MVFSKIFYRNCILLCRPFGITTDLVAPTDGAGVEDRSYDSNSCPKLDLIPSHNGIHSYDHWVLQINWRIVKWSTGRTSACTTNRVTGTHFSNVIGNQNLCLFQNLSQSVSLRLKRSVNFAASKLLISQVPSDLSFFLIRTSRSTLSAGLANLTPASFRSLIGRSKEFLRAPLPLSTYSLLSGLWLDLHQLVRYHADPTSTGGSSAAEPRSEVSVNVKMGQQCSAAIEVECVA